jgi:molecular chaperone DnaK
VTPLTLGVETLGGVATCNTPVPVQRAETFTTAADMQTSVTLHVFQGERPMAADNTSLGEFKLDGLPPAPRGVPKIEVSLDIDSSGILAVSARDTATDKSQSIRITGSMRLPEAENDRGGGAPCRTPHAASSAAIPMSAKRHARHSQGSDWMSTPPRDESPLGQGG